MPSKKWNTSRLSWYGALFGAVYYVVMPPYHWAVSGGVALAEKAGEIIGGAAGMAMLVAIVSSVRNLLLKNSN